MTTTQKVSIGTLEIRHVFADSIAFEQLICCSFLHMVGLQVKKLVIFCECLKCMTPNLSD